MVKRRGPMLNRLRKYRIIIVPGMMFCILSLLNTITAAGDGCLRIKIWADKQEYLLYEPISIKYEVYNTLETKLVTSFQTFDEFFNIRDNSGRSYPNLLISQYMMSDTLAPGGYFKGSEGIDSRYRIYNPGYYECIMDVPKTAIIPNCRDNPKSNLIEFSIKEPVGDERNALRMYLKADSLHWNTTETGLDKKARRKIAFDAYVDLADTYPSSVYAPRAIYMAILLNNSVDDKAAIVDLCKKIIERYSDSHFLADGFYYFAKMQKLLKDQTGSAEYMEYLIKKYPDSKISDRAEYWLAKIKAGDL
jgi:hypothetical protein